MATNEKVKKEAKDLIKLFRTEFPDCNVSDDELNANVETFGSWFDKEEFEVVSVHATRNNVFRIAYAPSDTVCIRLHGLAIGYCMIEALIEKYMFTGDILTPSQISMFVSCVNYLSWCRRKSGYHRYLDEAGYSDDVYINLVLTTLDNALVVQRRLSDGGLKFVPIADTSLNLLCELGPTDFLISKPDAVFPSQDELELRCRQASDENKWQPLRKPVIEGKAADILASIRARAAEAAAAKKALEESTV